jgi:hypothetical protein
VVTGVAPNSRAWLDVAVPWYNDPERWSVPLAASGPKEWQRVAVHTTKLPASATQLHGAGVTVDPTQPRPVAPTRISHIRNGDDRISFDVDRPGSPVLVKTSYFPNWQASGARGPWRVAPNLMVVIPTSSHVSLHYGRTPPDWIGILMTLLGIAGAFVLWRRGPLAIPEPAEPGPGDDAPVEQLALDFDSTRWDPGDGGDGGNGRPHHDDPDELPFPEPSGDPVPVAHADVVPADVSDAPPMGVSDVPVDVSDRA